MILPRISHTEVIVLSRGCTCLRSALPLARARSAPTQQNLHSPTEFRTHSCWDILPQISQIYTELLLRKLPQISQNTQNFLAEIFSHRFHRFTQNFLAEIFSHRIHRFTQKFLAGKNSVKSVDSVGDIRALTSVRICEICGSFFNCKLRVKSVGVFSTANLEQYRKDQSMRK